MATVRITDLAPFDGEYDLDVSVFNGTELHTIKQISGVRAGEITEGLQAGDYDLVVAFAVVVLRRAGKTVFPEQLFEATVGKIIVDLKDQTQEVEERPPASTPPAGIESKPDDGSEPNASTATSGSDSSGGSVEHRSHLSLTGPPGSETSATSDPETLAS